MWYPDYQNKNLNLCILNSFKGIIYASNKLLCRTLIIKLGNNRICVCYCNQMKTSLQESNKNTKYVLAFKYEQLHISGKTY